MIKYTVDYQYMPKESLRPSDDGTPVPIEATDASGVVIIPNVGDFVYIDNSTNERVSFRGRVKTRAFFYTGVGDDVFCHVNIVVAETDDNWGLLIKE